MGGVALEFGTWANGPGAGKCCSWNKSNGKYAVAQLFPWLLRPPDGLNLKQGTSGPEMEGAIQKGLQMWAACSPM